MVTARHLAKLLFLVSGAYLYRFRRSAEPADADRVPQEASETGRGRDAETPSELGTRGWRDILMRVYAKIAEDNLWVIAAGVARSEGRRVGKECVWRSVSRWLQLQ